MEIIRSRVTQVVRAGQYGSIVFEVDQKKRDFFLQVNLRVAQVGWDIGVNLLEQAQAQLWLGWYTDWVSWKTAPAGRPKPELPELQAIYRERTNIVNMGFNLQPGTYMLLLDNTYSKMTDKDVDCALLQRWDVQRPPKDLPIIDPKVIELPVEVYNTLVKANDCYTSAHYVQSAVMFRKAVDFAIKLKLVQEGFKEEELFDEQGNELKLSRKIGLLRSKDLISNVTSKHLDEIKWFGDLGAHGKMEMVLEDVKDIIEPKVRAFLAGLSLKL